MSKNGEQNIELRKSWCSKIFCRYGSHFEDLLFTTIVIMFIRKSNITDLFSCTKDRSEKKETNKIFIIFGEKKLLIKSVSI